MSERFNVAELRQWAEMDPSPSSRAAKLALVEAVDAAHAVMGKSSFHWENKETLALIDVLARFDFGGRP